LSIAAAITAAGCGNASRHYQLAPTRTCLNERGFRTQVENNWVVKPSQGSLLVTFGRGIVGLEFGSSGREANGIRYAMLRAGGKKWPVDARRNIAYVWDRKSKPHVAAVLDCLRPR